jgi:N utilization substance protein B
MSKGKRTKRDDIGRRRSRARRRALQALYQWQMAGQDLQDIDRQFAEEMDMSEIDLEFFREFLFEIPKQVSELDGRYKPFLDRDPSHLDPIERTILRMGAFELERRLDVPVRVVINEGVELAKLFGAEQSHKYINGVLDKVARGLPLRDAEIRAATRPPAE